MTIEEEFGIIDFETDEGRGVDLLPQILKSSNGIRNFILSIIPEIQELHDAQKDIYTTINLDSAVGVQLDNIFGEIIDLERTSGQTDEDYRIALKARISSFARSGEIAALKQGLRDLTGIDDVSLLEILTMTVLMHVFVDNFEDVANGPTVAATMRTLKAAGVYLDVGSQLNSSVFRFSDNVAGGAVGEGFAEALDGSDGGTFARLLSSFIFAELLAETSFGITTESGQQLLINYSS